MIYLSSSWKNRDRVRQLATALRTNKHGVYDFTDPECRQSPEIPPERFPNDFDPSRHVYREYITAVPEWRSAVDCNRRALEVCAIVVLMLPCGLDAHADAFYGLGRGKRLIVVGQPRAGERTPTHLWAEAILDSDDQVLPYLNRGGTRQRRRRDVADLFKGREPLRLSDRVDEIADHLDETADVFRALRNDLLRQLEIATLAYNDEIIAVEDWAIKEGLIDSETWTDKEGEPFLPVAPEPNVAMKSGPDLATIFRERVEALGRDREGE